MAKESQITLQKTLGSAFVLGIPAALFLVYMLTMVNSSILDFRVTPLSSCGLGMTAMFTFMLLVNLLYFEEIPIQNRRLTYNRANPNNSSNSALSNDLVSN